MVKQIDISELETQFSQCVRKAHVFLISEQSEDFEIEDQNGKTLKGVAGDSIVLFDAGGENPHIQIWSEMLVKEQALVISKPVDLSDDGVQEIERTLVLNGDGEVIATDGDDSGESAEVQAELDDAAAALSEALAEDDADDDDFEDDAGFSEVAETA